MAENIISAVLNWLRAGYPEGIPPKDSFPLIALLRRTLIDEDYEAIVAQLAADEAKKIRVRHIRSAIERATSEEPEEEDVREVAARLAAGGWPLSGKAMRLAEEIEPDPAQRGSADPAEGEAPADHEITDPGAPVDENDSRSAVERVIDWLRAGYPEGVPTTDYVPLLALLRRRLTDDEVGRVADELVHATDADGEVSRIDAQVLMAKVLNELPSDEDIRRVSDRLRHIGVTLI